MPADPLHRLDQLVASRNGDGVRVGFAQAAAGAPAHPQIVTPGAAAALLAGLPG